MKKNRTPVEDTTKEENRKVELSPADRKRINLCADYTQVRNVRSVLPQGVKILSDPPVHFPDPRLKKVGVRGV